MKKRSMIPRDFIVTPAMRELAQQNRWPSPDEEVAAFIDHHRAKGSLFLDHQAAFRTWLRNAARFRKQRLAHSSESPLRAITNHILTTPRSKKELFDI